MISFRHLLFSMVAVFLALGIGVLAGSTLLNQVTVDELERQANASITRANNLREELDRVEQELDAWRDLGAQLEVLVLDGQLEDEEVVLVTAEGVDLSQVDGVETAVERAGASVQAVLVMTARLGLPDEPAAQDLAEVLGMSSVDGPEALSNEAGRAIGERLVDGADGTLVDVLADLQGRSFLAIQTGAVLEDIGGSDQTVIVLSGDVDEPLVQPDMVFVPLVEALVEAGGRGVAGETLDTAYPFVSLIRQDQDLDGDLVTVDNADTLFGRLGLVLGLREFLETGTGGDYGVKTEGIPLIPAP